jgi:hypothetical protein
MTVEEIAQFVRSNLDRVVRVTSRSGEVEIARVLNVDGEGFVYIIDASDPNPKEGTYWTEFGEVTEVQSAGSGQTSN